MTPVSLAQILAAIASPSLTDAPTMAASRASPIEAWGSIEVCGSVDGSLSVVGFSTDSRTVAPGEVFVALTGENFDGHRFLGDAGKKGATAAIVSRQVDSDLPQILVSDTLTAYQAIARWWRHQCPAKVVAVTGSVGKTTTKELIAAVLSAQGQVLKTRANYNNEIGVPKTLLGLTPEHDYAVVEMGMRGPGEIALLSQIAQPDVAVITNVGTAHIERLGSEAAIAQAKCELLGSMPSDSVAVLNGDDPRLLETAATVWSGKTVTYGLESGDVWGTLDGAQIQVAGHVLPLPLPGRHNALNYLAAIAVAQALGLDWTSLEAGVSVTLPAGRAQRYELPNDVVLLDETYNAGLESMVAALTVLSETPGSRRIAVLGTMRELGDYSVALHQRVGEAVKALGIDCLLILADVPEQQALVAGATPMPLETFGTHADLTARLAALIQPGDRILFKASRAVGLETVVHALVKQLS
ncbi:MAG: UDP-N-acetylmuramoyl-tripeptide--D-alanyl-D-alanine ligase [Elainellaceae cyanobacterium]